MEKIGMYQLFLTVTFLVIGFVLVVVGFIFSNELFYVAVGWESAVVFFIILMQEPIYNYISHLHEVHLLKKKGKIAARIQKEFNGS